MGMGEPLANYDRTWQALRVITDKDGFNLGRPPHYRLHCRAAARDSQDGEEPLQVNLAVSLHAANDLLRTQLVPINHRYPLAEVLTAVRGYVAHTNRRVTFEYALMNGINDMPAQAPRACDLVEGVALSR